ncbi:hypothetical protein Barb4_05163 [Bacteroidales bacterium Barb4]|nr:hypothetical protein Barb4_05163 [Bacteroidales bacterium Barb4]
MLCAGVAVPKLFAGKRDTLAFNPAMSDVFCAMLIAFVAVFIESSVITSVIVRP